MGKAVKSVAKVAAVGAAIYFGGSALMSAVGGATATGAATGGGTLLGSILSSKGLAVAGLALQGLSMTQAKQAQDQSQAAEQRRQDLEQKFASAQAQKERIAMIRQQRILAGRAEATAANKGFAPGDLPSSSITGTSSLITQSGVAQADLTGRVAYSGQVAQATTDMYTAANTASGWKDMAGLGESVWKNSQSLKTIFS